MKTAVLGLLLFLAASAASAAEIVPSAATPSRDTTPVLTLVAGGRQWQLSRAEIEQRPLFDTTLATGEGMSGRFTGVRLAGFLREQGLLGAERLRFIAADGYTVFIATALIEQRTYLLATRFEGEPMTLREKGPLRLLRPAVAEAVRSGDASAAHWIWALTEIRTY